ncbi:hypothetical protein ABZ461_39485, partial [Actinacidiphila glaucinigra]
TRHVIPAAEPPTSCLTSGNAAITCGKTTASELDRASQDPDWALHFAEKVQDTEEESEPAPTEARHFSTSKT